MFIYRVLEIGVDLKKMNFYTLCENMLVDPQKNHEIICSFIMCKYGYPSHLYSSAS